MANFILAFLIGAIVGLAAGYVYRTKKRGIKCIGCPDAKTCSGNCGSCGGGCPGCGT